MSKVPLYVGLIQNFKDLTAEKRVAGKGVYLENLGEFPARADARADAR